MSPLDALPAALGAAAVLAALALALALRSRQMHRWIWSYLAGLPRRRRTQAGPVHVIVCVADHYEPATGGVPMERERARVDAWMRGYPALAAAHRDADGVPPLHTFFFPEEEYREEHLDKLAALCRAGFGDVEIHLHHDRDDAPSLRRKLDRFKTILHDRHGMLRRDEDGRIVYGFIHGNWALDNSDPAGRYCGVNNELTVLRETGCYADFTLPAAPEGAQTRKINSIYYAADDPEKPKSHNSGVDVAVGGRPSGDLMIVQGPLTLNWSSRKFGILPRIESGELSGDNPPSPERADLWIRQGIHVKGRPEWIFVKLHCHGALEESAGVLLGAPMDETLRHLEARYNDGMRYRLHYVTAWEMYRLIKAAESGATGDPGMLRRLEARADLRAGAPADRQALA